MAKFNLKEHIAKNKATFFGSLTEGQFSWMTQDTDQQIGSEKENTISVYMHDNKGNKWFEDKYDGYGEFGGKDYYELLDQMNGGTGDRSEGIRKAFDPTLKGKLLFPALTVSSTLSPSHDFTREAEHDPNQSWYSPEYEDDEDDYDYGMGFGDMDTPENYDELDEDKKEYYKDAEADDAEHIKALEKDMEDDKKSSKMKKSELKAKIKEMIVAEMTIDIEDTAKEDDFLAEIAAMLDESPMNDPRTAQIIQMLRDMEVDGETMEYILRQVGMEDQMANQLVRNKMELDSVNEMKTMLHSKFDEEGYEGSDDHFQDTIDESGLWPALMKFKDEGFSLEHVVGWIEANWYMIKEAEETEKDTAEVDTADVTVDDTETTDVETTAEVDPNVKAVQDSLTQAQAAAQALGDKKLIDQIGNTITFFTRAHVVEKPKAAGAIAESMFPMLNKILK